MQAVEVVSPGLCLDLLQPAEHAMRHTVSESTLQPGLKMITPLHESSVP